MSCIAEYGYITVDDGFRPGFCVPDVIDTQISRDGVQESEGLSPVMISRSLQKLKESLLRQIFCKTAVLYTKKAVTVNVIVVFLQIHQQIPSFHNV